MNTECRRQSVRSKCASGNALSPATAGSKSWWLLQPQARKASPEATKIPPAFAGSLNRYMVSELLGENKNGT